MHTVKPRPRRHSKNIRKSCCLIEIFNLLKPHQVINNNLRSWYLAWAGSSFFCTAAETLFLITGIWQCPSWVTVTGYTIWEVPVTHRALIAAWSPKGRLTLAKPSEHITLMTGWAHTTAIASLKERRETKINKRVTWKLPESMLPRLSGQSRL